MSWRLLAILCIAASALVAGCNATWFSQELTYIKVDPAALAEVQGLGRVVARTSADPMHEGTVQVVEILVVDVGASDFAEALDLARDRLQQRGWSIDGGDDVTVIMESSQWKETTAWLGPLKDMGSLGAALEAEAGKALEADPEKSSYILVAVSRA